MTVICISYDPAHCQDTCPHRIPHEQRDACKTHCGGWNSQPDSCIIHRTEALVLGPDPQGSIQILEEKHAQSDTENDSRS